MTSALRLGRGLALASDVLALPLLLTGERELPFDHWHAVRAAYRLSYPAQTGAPAARDAFLQFVRAEASAFAEQLACYRAAHP